MNKNPRTAVIEVRTDVRLLSALAMFFDSVGRPARSKSELVHDSLELLVVALERQEKLTRPQSSAEAVRTLEIFGLGSANRSGRGIEALATQLSLEGSLGVKHELPIEEDEESLLKSAKHILGDI